MRKSQFWVGLVLVLSMACDRIEEPVIEKGDLNYLPLQVGAFFIYDVDSTSILFQIETTYQFQIKHTVVDSFRNAEGGYTYIIARHKRANENEPWSAAPTWQARATEREAVLVEGNTSFVKMVFPISEGVRWNGNAMNSLEGTESCGDNILFDCDTYEAKISTDTYSLPAGLTFIETVKVVEHDSPDPITIHDVRYAVYAKGVGLVEREMTYLKYCSDQNLGCVGKKIIDKGTRFKMLLREYGHL